MPKKSLDANGQLYGWYLCNLQGFWLTIRKWVCNGNDGYIQQFGSWSGQITTISLAFYHQPSESSEITCLPNLAQRYCCRYP